MRSLHILSWALFSFSYSVVHSVVPWVLDFVGGVSGHTRTIF